MKCVEVRDLEGNIAAEAGGPQSAFLIVSASHFVAI